MHFLNRLLGLVCFEYIDGKASWLCVFQVCPGYVWLLVWTMGRSSIQLDPIIPTHRTADGRLDGGLAFSPFTEGIVSIGCWRATPCDAGQVGWSWFDLLIWE